MPCAAIYCASIRRRLALLVKQYSDVKHKQYRTVIDDARAPRSEAVRLQSVFDELHQDYASIDALSDQIDAVSEEWFNIVSGLQDESLETEARRQFEDFQRATNWDNIQNILCDELLQHLAALLGKCDTNIDFLSKKLAAEPVPFSPWTSTVPLRSPSNASAATSNLWQESCPADNAGGSIPTTSSSLWTSPAVPPRTSALPQPQQKRAAVSSPWATLTPPPPCRSTTTTASHHDGRDNKTLPTNGATYEVGQKGGQEGCPADNAGGSLSLACERASPPADNAGGSSDAVRSPISTLRSVSQELSESSPSEKRRHAGLCFDTDNCRKPAVKPPPTAAVNQQQRSLSEVHRGPCVFCNRPGHRSTHRLNYGTFEKRLLRAARRSVCVACCTLQPEPHLWKECPQEPLQCSHCKQRGHHQAFCRSWLRIVANRISRRRPPTITGKFPNHGRSSSTPAQAPRRRTAKKSCKQLPCTCHRDDCQYVIPLPWKTTIKADSDVAALSEAAKTLSIAPSPATPFARSPCVEQSKPQAPPTRAGFTAARGGARNAPRRPATNNDVSTAASSGLTAHSAKGNLRGSAPAGAFSPPYPCMRDRLRATMCNTATDGYVGCGQCSSCSSPLLIGADGKPSNGASDIFPPDFAAAPVCHTSRRPLRRRVVRFDNPRLQRPRKRPAGTVNPRRGRRPKDSEDEYGANPPLSEKEQRALDAELDSDNESYLSYGSPYAAPPYARPHSPSGGFGPHIGREDEAPEDFALNAEVENYWHDEPTSTATFTSPKRHASEIGRGSELGYHHADYGPNAQQTSRGAVYEDRNYDYLYEDDYNGADPYEDHSYAADRYEDHVYGGDFYDDDSAY
ncbi:hypothetical protein AAVH_38130 [Aphelenchoides avenae]|nr:hypothetical protein AAVH_38130 [Aphelenchus avenae]